MTFRISGCKHHTDMIFVSILTISRPGMSKMLKQFTYLKHFTLELKVIYIFHMTLLISGCMPTIDSILVSILTFSMSRISKNPKSATWPWWLTLIFKVKPYFFEIIIIFKVSLYSYIIYFRFFEFLDLDYVKINTKIKSVACIQPEIIKVTQNYVWPWFSRSTIKVRWHMLVILRFPTSVMFKSTARKSLYHVCNPWWTMGHNK